MYRVHIVCVYAPRECIPLTLTRIININRSRLHNSALKVRLALSPSETTPSTSILYHIYPERDWVGLRGVVHKNDSCPRMDSSTFIYLRWHLSNNKQPYLFWILRRPMDNLNLWSYFVFFFFCFGWCWIFLPGMGPLFEESTRVLL